MRVIGLTGGVGAGKSLILSILKEEYGASVIIADQVAHELMKPGEEGYFEVLSLLGEDILNSDGTIDRQILAEKIFRDKSVREQVNSIIHPIVWKTIREKISSSQAELIVVEFAIMDKEGTSVYDEMWYVHAFKQNRIFRLMENRGYTKEHSENIIASQASEEEYASRCDRVIENNGSVEELRKQLAEILNNKG